MTPVEYIVCVTAFTTLSSSGNHKFNMDTHRAIAANICAAANKHGTNPTLLAAYIMTENRRFDPFLDMAAGGGVDRGLYHINSRYHGHRPNYQFVNHPYYATELASQVIRENFELFGTSWKSVAAYFSREGAKHETSAARAYYDRWLKNFREAERVFADAAARVNSQVAQGAR